MGCWTKLRSSTFECGFFVCWWLLPLRRASSRLVNVESGRVEPTGGVDSVVCLLWEMKWFFLQNWGHEVLFERFWSLNHSFWGKIFSNIICNIPNFYQFLACYVYPKASKKQSGNVSLWVTFQPNQWFQWFPVPTNGALQNHLPNPMNSTWIPKVMPWKYIFPDKSEFCVSMKHLSCEYIMYTLINLLSLAKKNMDRDIVSTQLTFPNDSLHGTRRI